MVKSVLILCDKGPFGTNSANEAIRLGSGFLGLGEDLDCKIIFMGDSVLFMRNNLKADLIGMDSLEDGIEMADLTDMPVVLVKEDMESRGVNESDLVEYEEISIINKSEIPKIIGDYDTVFKI